jgi:hypothetical protein
MPLVLFENGSIICLKHECFFANKIINNLKLLSTSTTKLNNKKNIENKKILSNSFSSFPIISTNKKHNYNNNIKINLKNNNLHNKKIFNNYNNINSDSNSVTSSSLASHQHQQQQQQNNLYKNNAANKKNKKIKMEEQLYNLKIVFEKPTKYLKIPLDLLKRSVHEEADSYVDPNSIIKINGFFFTFF